MTEEEDIPATDVEETTLKFLYDALAEYSTLAGFVHLFVKNRHYLGRHF
jgi:hypothetical protein